MQHPYGSIICDHKKRQWLHRHNIKSKNINREHSNLNWTYVTGRWHILRQDELGMIPGINDSFNSSVSNKAYEQETRGLKDTGLARYRLGHS